MSSKEKTEDSARTKWMLRFFAIAIAIILWQILGSILNPIFLSTPVAISAAFIQLIRVGGGPFSPPLVSATIGTLKETIVSFVIAIVVGFPIGLLIGVSRRLDIALHPYISALYVTPRIALVPLIVIWFGIGFNAIIVSGFILAVFPVIINTYTGVRDMGKNLLETASVFQIRGMRRLRLIIFPSILPFFMTGLRLGIGQALNGVIFAQLLMAVSGLGFLLSNFASFFETASVMAIVVVLMIIGVTLTYGIEAIENRMAHWKITERGYI